MNFEIIYLLTGYIFSNVYNNSSSITVSIKPIRFRIPAYCKLFSRKTIIKFGSVIIKISIFPYINNFNWSNFEDKELIFKLPIINLSKFFVLILSSIDVTKLPLSLLLH